MDIYGWSDIPEKHVFEGARRRTIVGEKVLILRQWWEPGCEGPGLHSHAEEEQFTLVLEGEVEVTVDGEKATLRAGQVVRFPPGSQHMTRAVGDRPTFLEEVFSPVPEAIARQA
ncbi:MAG: cupin domain-containing protein [Nitrospinota bacterium]